LNCGKGSRDNKKNIKKNINFVANKMKIKSTNLILMNQIHGNKVVEIKKENYKKKIVADAIITRMRGVSLGVLTADCVPIILYDVENKIIGCIHAGWRGAFKNIIKNTILKIRKISLNNKIYASVGPCIGQRSYEVDNKFYKQFVNKSKKNKAYFKLKNKTAKLFNLRKFVTDKLKEFKVIVDQVNHDTFTEKNNFFSYRRSSKLKQKDYGRCISTISIL
jgi:YfiH family protein